MFSRTLLFIVVFSAVANVAANHLERFKQWASDHKIELPSDDSRFLHMLTNWRNNDKLIDETNFKNLTYTLGHNAYSAMNSDEFAELMRFGYNREIISSMSSDYSGSAQISSNVGAPASVDWRTKGVVSPIQDQGQAGTCYSFSTTAAIETALAIKTGTLTKMSEQQIVDCSTIKNGGPNMGVNGGQISATFEWVDKNGGLCAESAYPYVSGTTKTTGTCQKGCSKVSGSAVSSVVDVKPKSDSELMNAISTTIVSIAIEADQSTFQLYKSGVFTGACGTNLDHAVALVGYGTSNGVEYYTMRNSWGASWGQSGYMLIGKGNDPATGKPYNGGAGQCGLLMEASYPVM
jgi:xylem cysteine proteinase